MIFGLAAIPIFLGVGLTIDYANGARKWSAMDAAADAAALAAITPSMMADCRDEYIQRSNGHPFGRRL